MWELRSCFKEWNTSHTYILFMKKVFRKLQKLFYFSTFFRVLLANGLKRKWYTVFGRSKPLTLTECGEKYINI